jgi:hypothetical protein
MHIAAGRIRSAASSSGISYLFAICISLYQVPGRYSMEPRRDRRALPPFGLGAGHLALCSISTPWLSPPGSLVHSTEETRVAPNIGWNQYSTGIWSRGRTNEVAV